MQEKLTRDEEVAVEEMFKELPSSLQLIDFGKSIDLKLLPKGILFTKV